MLNRPLRSLLFFSGLILLVILIMQPLELLQFYRHIAVLFPKGAVAIEERNLLLFIQALMLLVVLPVYFLTFFFSWRYRAGQTRAKYEPDLIDSRIAEYIWWGAPFVLTFIVAVLTVIKTHQLDPYKPIPSSNKEITIQAVALQWKWLFIYPEEGIAAVNFLQFPKDTPLHFEITADAPMNALWIPDLGGQIYAMPKMKTHLHLIANEVGDFRGLSSNISGVGFAGMHFIARSSTREDYDRWVKSAKQSTKTLDFLEYSRLAEKSKNNPKQIYILKEGGLFDQIMMQYMEPKKE